MFAPVEESFHFSCDFEHSFAVVKDLLACRGQRERATVAGEQFLSHLTFERFNLGAQTALAGVELVSRSGNAFQFGDDIEIVKMVEIAHASIKPELRHSVYVFFFDRWSG